MKARIKPKLSNQWKRCFSLIFELYESDIYVYEDCQAFIDKEIIEDCTLEIDVNGLTKQFNVRGGCIQNLWKSLNRQ